MLVSPACSQNEVMSFNMQMNDSVTILKESHPSCPRWLAPYHANILRMFLNDGLSGCSSSELRLQNTFSGEDERRPHESGLHHKPKPHKNWPKLLNEISFCALSSVREHALCWRIEHIVRVLNPSEGRPKIRRERTQGTEWSSPLVAARQQSVSVHTCTHVLSLCALISSTQMIPSLSCWFPALWSFTEKAWPMPAPKRVYFCLPYSLRDAGWEAMASGSWGTQPHCIESQEVETEAHLCSTLYPGDLHI